MLKELFSLFRSTDPNPGVAPNPGEKWSLIDNDESPWPNKTYKPVTVLEVKAGWVRFSMGGSMFNDERMAVKLFVRIYKPYQGSVI